jgi:hypothetical protein
MKKNISLKSSLVAIGIAACTSMFHTEIVTAQITFGEVKEKPKEVPEWEKYYKQELCAPYDSTYMFVKPFPLIDAYKKYIGQQLFLLEFPNNTNMPLIFTEPKDYTAVQYNNRTGRNESMTTKVNVYHPVGYYDTGHTEYKNDIEKVTKKYYEVIDVRSLNEDENSFSLSNKEFEASRVYFPKYGDTERYERYNKKGEVARVVPPCFILKETQSGDTVYTYKPDVFIIVGAFVKLQKEYIGKTIAHFDADYDDSNGYNNRERIIKLQNTWICKDVTFIDNRINFILQDVNDKSIEQNLERNKMLTFNELTTMESGSISKKRDLWASEQEFDQYSNAVLAVKQTKEQEQSLAEQKKKEERQLKEQQHLEWQKQNAAAATARKQALINKYGQAMGLKVFNAEPAIGMTKAMFNDMNLPIESSQKTETANGTVETYLCFGGYKRIILTNGKITQIDTVR